MPNIEIHGYALSDYGWGAEVPKTALELREKIFEVFIKEPFLADMVINIVLSDTCDHKNISQPFLRVYSTPGPDVDRVIELLDVNFDMDVEGPIAIKFRPRKSIRNKQSI